MRRALALGCCSSFVLLVAHGCGSVQTTSSGGAGPTGGAGGHGGSGGSGATTASSSSSSSSSSTSASSGTGPCVGGQEQCVNGVHQICGGGIFSDVPCPTGKGCTAATGTCMPCVCTPGAHDASCIDGGTQSLCDPSCLAFAPAACAVDEICLNGACVTQICVPGEPHCVSSGTTEICNATGSGYDPGTTCGPKQQCFTNQGCISLCELYAKTPSSVGCSFFALNMDNFDEANPDAVTVGNVSSTLTAVVDFHGSYNGVETLIQGGIQVPPLTQHTITLPNGAIDYLHGVSALRKGGSFRVASDLPIIAYQHSPLTPAYTNDASCLLPEATLGTHYFVPSYYDALGAGGEPHPSYFNVIATANNTTVTVVVPNPTAAGSGVPQLAAGQTQTFMLNRYDTLQLVNLNAGPTAQRDLMGAEITSNAPVAVFGAVECAQVPAGYTYCDHIEEQAIPVRNWGKTYVAAHIPKRSNSERYYWRVMARDDDTVIDTTPPQSGFPVTIAKGKFHEFYTQANATPQGGSFILSGSKPFSAFQYITGQNAFGAGTGDPAMITAVPVEQFLSRYVILTPTGYTSNYVQIVRTTADDVTVDGVMVPPSAYYAIGAYTIADYAVSAGPHVILSNSPFGIVGTGYTYATSYGYPGGLALNNIAPP